MKIDIAETKEMCFAYLNGGRYFQETFIGSQEQRQKKLKPKNLHCIYTSMFWV